MSDISLVLANLDWRQPLWLLVALQPLLLWLVVRWLQQHKEVLFADAHLLPWIQVRQKKTVTEQILSRNSAYGLAWILMALTLAGPRLPDDRLIDHNEINLDVMMVIDLSRSMHATDIQPSRLRRATLEAYEFLSLAKNTRVGIIVYAARAHLFVPLTKDHNALKFYLQDLDSLQLPTKGSNAKAAIQLAKDELQQAEKTNLQALLWLTDGDIELEDMVSMRHMEHSTPLKNLLTQISAEKMHTFILGIGTLEGSGIPLADGSWATLETGQGVVTTLNTVLLQQLAEIGGGRFAIVSDDEADWDSLYRQGMLAGLSFSEDDETKHWQQLYPWFLFPAIVFFIAALLPFRMKKQSADTPVNMSTARVNPIAILLIALAFLSVFPVDVVAADKSYAVFSSTLFKGIDAYKKAEFSTAQRHFIKAVLDADTDSERAIALHNLGNVLFQRGDYAQATELFADALRYNPSQQQTVNNQKLTFSLYTLLQKRLEKKRLKAQRNSLNAATIQGGSLFDLPALSPSTLNTQTKNLLEFSLPEIPEEVLNALLEKGLDYLQVMEGVGGGDKGHLKKQKERRQALDHARVYLQNIETGSSNALWKRLFEIEEGFPAKLEEPKAVPGLLPW